MRQRLLRLGVVALLIGACGETDHNLLAPAPQASMVGETIVILAGNGQMGVANTALKSKLKFRVRDAANNPLPGARGTITVTAGGGTVDKATFRTNTNGDVVVVWTLGSTGAQTVTVALDGGTPSAQFNATVIPTNSDVSATAGNNQTALPGQVLTKTIRATFLFPNGSPIAGWDIQWSVKAGAGTLAAATSRTNSNGHTTNTWTLGWGSVTQVVMAKVEGVDSANFTATADTAGYTFVYRTATNAEAVADSAYTVAVEVKRFGVAVAGARGTFSIVSGGGSLSRTVISTALNGRETTAWTLGFVGEQRMRATIGAFGSRDLIFQFPARSCPDPINELTGMDRAITDAFYRILPNFTNQTKANSIRFSLACIYWAMREGRTADAASDLSVARSEMQSEPFQNFADPADAGAVMRLLDELDLIL